MYNSNAAFIKEQDFAMEDKLILIVDDKFSATRLIAEYLESKGFQTISAPNGIQALTEARINHPDLILLDIMMPHMDGYEFIRTFRKENSAPIILLTAKVEETDKVMGLSIGADDYVTKPFSMAELAARIEAVLRRVDQPVTDIQMLQFGALKIYPEQFLVFIQDKEIKLTPMEFKLLLTLASHPGRVFTREQLLSETMEDSFEALEKTITVHIRNLRVKIEPDPACPIFVQTVFGVGYKLNNGLKA